MISFVKCINTLSYNFYPYIATCGQSWNASLAENLKSLDLQDGPRKWLYFPNSYPPTHPPIPPQTFDIFDISATTGRILLKFETKAIGIKS